MERGWLRKGWKGMRGGECRHYEVAGDDGGSAGHHDERDCPFRLANTGAIGFLSAATAATVVAAAAAFVTVADRTPVARQFFMKFPAVTRRRTLLVHSRVN